MLLKQRAFLVMSFTPFCQNWEWVISSSAIAGTWDVTAPASYYPSRICVRLRRPAPILAAHVALRLTSGRNPQIRIVRELRTEENEGLPDDQRAT